ncbi:MAG: hypothetical protein HY928_06100 [Elusimicrobia bacterium]|nr:hypothetical protein [Elusimicrobiota bacterium]
MRTAALLCLALALPELAPGAPAAEQALNAEAESLYRRAQQGKFYAEAARLKPEVLPTSDGKSFLVVWKGAARPKRWIASLHGTGGFATDDLALWHPRLAERGIGLVCLQWWLGSEGPRAYYRPQEVYRELDRALRRLGAKPGSVMLHGFSRGSANSYAVAALDAGRGARYFSLIAASSGGVSTDYPPTRAIVDGEFGKEPLKGTRWVTAAGAKDRNPDRDGIPGMRRTAEWLRGQGAVVLEAIEDPDQGHGALQRNPKNAERLLDLFLAR